MDFERAWSRAVADAARDLWAIDAAQDRLQPTIETPSDPAFGDATTGLPLKLARDLKRPPRKIAEELAAKLAGLPGAARIEIAGAGFVNLTADAPTQALTIDAARKDPAGFGRSAVGNRQKVLVEHTSANPTGPLHIAHGRQAAVGDSLARILDFAGHEAGREFYINDTGNQMENLGRSILARHLETKGKTLEFEGKPYLFDGSNENAYRGDYIKEIAKKLTEPATVETAARLGKEFLLGEIRRDLEQFRARFDRWTSQEELEKNGAVSKLVADLKTKGLAYEKDGALWLKSKDAGDTDDKVLVKKDGLFTYRTPDIAYHLDKFKRGWERLIDLWGPDHHAHIQGMTIALKMLGLPHDRFTVLIVQHCRLLKDGQEVKMGKRLASYVTLRELMEEVGVDATRWFFAMRKTDSHLDFDMSLAVKQSADNPVFYVQYAHARITSVLRKGGEPGLFTGPFDASALGPEEILLVRHVRGFQRAVERAARDLDPSTICTYAHGLAAAYQHYQTAGKNDPAKRILIDDERLRSARLATICAVKVALKNALHLVGVEAPDRMTRDEEEQL